MAQPKKIVIIGISGTGKTHLARRLAQKTGLPLVHMDQLWWQPNWNERDEKTVINILQSQLEKSAWIIEGYIGPLGKERLQAADVIIYLDYSGLRAAWGGLCRMWQYRKKPRPEMPAGCQDHLSFSFLKTMLFRSERSEIEAAIAASGEIVKGFKSRQALEQFLTVNF